jgi:ribose-phosphate pyrophosphokinase
MKNMILLADKNSLAWDFSKKIQNHFEIDFGMNVSLAELSVKSFRNNELNISGVSNLRGKDIYYITDSLKKPNDWWAELLLVKDLVLNASANSLSFVLPDMYYSRQDRKGEPRVPISARAIANSISSGIKRIITMDLHAAQIQGFYPANVPVDNLYSFPEVSRYLIKNYSEELKNLLILSPDAGGVERVKSFLKRIGKLTPENIYDIGFMIKDRPKAGEVGTMKYVGSDYAGKNVLIIDDIVDSGGTLCKSAEILRKGGANKIYCYATHGLFTKGVDELNLLFDKVLTSNTHYQKENVEVIDISLIFAEAIYRAQTNQSVSELFR